MHSCLMREEWRLAREQRWERTAEVARGVAWGRER
jgi:hypothetical protein